MKSPRASKQKSDRSRLLLRPSAPADLQQKVQQVQFAISRRAHELFEARGREPGHDLEDWLRAESELLCPVSIAMSESKGLVSVRAEVPGFRKNEIELSVEPRCITILGKRKQANAKFEMGTPEESQPHPDQILEDGRARRRGHARTRNH